MIGEETERETHTQSRGTTGEWRLKLKGKWTRILDREEHPILGNRGNKRGKRRHNKR